MSPPEENDNSEPDSTLVERAKKGNERAFEILVERYKRLVFTIILSIVGHSEEVYDLTQLVIEKAWYSLKSLDDNARFKAWLCTIARNTALDAVRAQKPRKQNEEAFDNANETNYFTSLPNPEDTAIIRDLINRAVAKIPIKERICFVLWYFKGLSKQEIASIAEIDVASISTYTSKGKRLFKQFYAEQKQDIADKTLSRGDEQNHE